MRKIIFILFFCILFCEMANSQTLKGMNDAQQLGSMAGLALACNAGSRLDDFQLIASYIIGNQNPTKEKREKAFKAFAAEKLRTYNLQKDSPAEDCPTILKHFYNLDIFNCTIYSNGDVKFPDGKILRAPTKEQINKETAIEKKKKSEPKRNYLIPARK